MKVILPLLLLLVTLSANAQNYLISFSGTGLSSVKVENLTSGLTVNLNADDVLHLSTTTAIYDFSNPKSVGLKIYPNPMADNSTLNIFPPISGDVIISICDISGKVIAHREEYLENYVQKFIISGIGNGLYVVNIQGTGYQFSDILLSVGKSYGKAAIEWLNNNIQSKPDKNTTTDTKGYLATVDMAYNTGERLKYTAVSGNNSTIITDIPTEDKTVSFTFFECKDGDNNYYPIVQIGSQIWMAENLKTQNYTNGESIGTTTPATLDISGLITPKYQWPYAGNESNVPTYGRLYTWFAVTDTRKICPTGWHLPTDIEWWTLENYLIANGYNYDGTTSVDKTAKSLATTFGWNFSLTEGAAGNTDYPAIRNSTGYTSLPAGYRSNVGSFSSLGDNCTFWSSTIHSVQAAWCRTIYNINSYLAEGGGNKMSGFSVRCIKD